MALTKITKTGITADAIDATKIADNAVETAQIKADAVNATKIADDAISEEHLDVTAITGHSELSAAAADDDVLLVYDTSAGVIKKIQSSNVGTTPPTFSSVSPTSLLTGDGTGNYTIVVTGTKFDATATFKLRTSGGTDITLNSVSRDSSTQLTGTVAKNTANLTNANEPFDIIITNGNALKVTAENQINIDEQPVYVTSSGTLGTFTGNDSVNVSVNATDPESAGNVTFELQSGTIPPGLSLSNSGADGGRGIISGTATDPASNTTYNFTLRAVDAASNTTSRAFSITVNKQIQYQSFTSSGTFSVPSGTTVVDVLVVAGGGGAAVGGGGAGGLIFMPEYPVTPGGTVTVTVGCGGAGSTNTAQNRSSSGQDSVFGTLTTKGGGGSGNHVGTAGINGGSGGGAGRDGGGASGGTATQPTQPGNSGAYGFGNPGGSGPAPSGSGGGGGGGAGAAGQPGAQDQSPSPTYGQGGIGKAYTIADGTTSVYYAGGGGAYGELGSPTSRQGGQGGGGPVNTSGTANRGGGAGGQPISPSSCNSNAAGGKGIVIVKY